MAWRGRARSVEPSLCSTRESVEREDRRRSHTAPSRIIRAKADALRAKLDVGKPAIAMAAHNLLAAKLATEAGFNAA
jgi:hypothetical protein